MCSFIFKVVAVVCIVVVGMATLEVIQDRARAEAAAE